MFLFVVASLSACSCKSKSGDPNISHNEYFVVLEHGPGIDIFTPGKPGDYELDGGIWEDEDARNFYENLVDLKAFVPAILFKDNEKASQGKDRDENKGRELYHGSLSFS